MRRLTIASAPGLVAVLRIVPLGDNVALGEMVQRVLSSSQPPRTVFGGGDARRKLARRAPRGTRAVWGLFLASRAAWPPYRPRTRCSSPALAPPQDRENCHACGNVFVLFDGFAPVTLCNLYLHRAIKSLSPLRGGSVGVWIYRGLQVSNMCEISSVGARQHTRGCSPRGLGGVFVLVQGL